MHVAETGTWVKAESLDLKSKLDDCFTFSLLQTSNNYHERKNMIVTIPKTEKIQHYRFTMLGQPGCYFFLPDLSLLEHFPHSYEKLWWPKEYQ